VVAMVDARMPDRWLSDRRLLRLSPSAFRTFVMALMWSVSNRTDGLIEPNDLDLIPGASPDDLHELVRRELVERDGGFLRLVDFAATQTSRAELEVLENVRRREREKKARQREAKAGKGGDPEETDGDSPPGTSPGTVPRDRTGKARQGQARQGQAPRERPPTGRDDGPTVEEWDGATRCTATGHDGMGRPRRDCSDCGGMTGLSRRDPSGPAARAAGARAAPASAARRRSDDEPRGGPGQPTSEGDRMPPPHQLTGG
jgi:hypothetical protein